MNKNDVSFIRITQPAFVKLRKDYDRILKSDAKYYSLGYSEVYKESYKDSNVCYRIDCAHIYVGAWDEKLPDDVVKINIQNMEFYVYPDLKEKLSTSTIDLMYIFSTDGNHQISKYVLIDSSHIKSVFI